MTWLTNPGFVIFLILGALAAFSIGVLVARGARDRRFDRAIAEARKQLNPQPTRTTKDADDARERARADVRRQMERRR